MEGHPKQTLLATGIDDRSEIEKRGRKQGTVLNNPDLSRLFQNEQSSCAVPWRFQIYWVRKSAYDLL
jgi:hypothetical protein